MLFPLTGSRSRAGGRSPPSGRGSPSGDASGGKLYQVMPTADSPVENHSLHRLNLIYVRVGSESGNAGYYNKDDNGDHYGDKLISSIVITEIQA